jgi:hemolysin D
VQQNSSGDLTTEPQASSQLGDVTPSADVPAYAMTTAGVTLTFETDTEIFKEGDASDFAYIVVEGGIELTKDMSGSEVFLAEIGPGDLFGEMGLIDGSLRSATATSLGNTVLMKIDREELMRKLGQDGDFAAPVLGQLVAQLRNTSDRLAHERHLTLQRAAETAEYIEPVSMGPLARLRYFFDAEQDLIEFQPDAVEIDRQKFPAVAKVMLYVIIFFITGLFVWANYSTIDTAVAAFGRMTTKVPNIIVQPSETAKIMTIHVRAGDIVEKGQLLATLDATNAQSDANVSRTSLLQIRAQERRLAAEISGKVIPGGFSKDAAVNNLQQKIFDRRQTRLEQQQASFREQIQQIKSDISSNIQDAEDLGEQAEVLKEIEAMRAGLMKKGVGSRVNYLSSKHQRLSVDREKRQLLSARRGMEHQLKSLQADRRAALAESQSRVAQELVDTRRERERLSEQLIKSDYREALVKLTAPAPGVVLKVAERSVGSVIQQAEMMFTIVPANVPVEMEVDVQPKDIGLIQVGDVVRVKLDALPFQKHGIIEGRVRFISEDAVQTEDREGRSVYRSRVELMNIDLRKVPDSFRLTPGLTGSADITVGKRRIITYFIYPLVRAFDSSFKEP